MSISVKQVTKMYGAQYALNAISFEIPSGQVVGFLGPNGAGKSTTMKILTGFIPPSSGTALVCEKDVQEASVEVRKMVGYLPEHNPLYKEMYVQEFLAFAAGLQDVKNISARVNDMIALTGLTPEKHKKIHQLSKGYRQRVGIAQAMIHNPKVLILDEPTSGLDPNQLEDIRSLIVEIGKEKTVLLSTHIMQEVEAMCQRVIIINKGTIVADDATSVLKKQQGKEEIITIEFQAAVDISLLNALPFVQQVEKIGETSYKIRCTNTANDVRDELFKFAVEKGWSIRSLQKETRDLEQVFKSLTQKNK